MWAVKEAYFEHDGARLHYLEWGERTEDRPALLLLHGLSSNARFWERTARELDGRHVVALDQRSHGLSDPARDGATTDDFAADVHGLSRHLDLRRPVVAGHSWGAAIAVAYAAYYPSEVSGLAAIDGPVWPAGIPWDNIKDFVQPPFPLFPALEDAYTDASHYLSSAWAEDLMPFVDAGLKPEAGGYRSTLTVPVRYDILRALFEADMAGLWRRVEVPITILFARDNPGQFRDMKEAGSAHLATLLPQARQRWFDTPHDIPLFAPAEIAAELERLAGA
jgi:pimeloyl-ACP methyl ester carboxylesterase